MSTSPAYAERLTGRLARAVERGSVPDVARLVERVSDVLVGALLFDNPSVRQALHRGVERAYTSLKVQDQVSDGQHRLLGMLEVLTAVTGMAVLRQKAEPAADFVGQAKYRRRGA